jgi:CheY-like chemotaxis protein
MNLNMKQTMKFPTANINDICSTPVLCADDDPAIRQCFTKALSKAGYSVLTAANGQDAWEALKTGSFDLLITDQQMPRMTGAELVLKARLEGMTLPIIVAASNLEFFSDPRNRWLKVTTLQKPFVLGELTEAVGRILCAAHHVGWGKRRDKGRYEHCNENPAP